MAVSAVAYAVHTNKLFHKRWNPHATNDEQLVMSAHDLLFVLAVKPSLRGCRRF